MSNDERWSNDWAKGKYYGETYQEAPWRRQEEFRERQRLDELDKVSKSSYPSTRGYYGEVYETSYEPIRLSKLTLYLGIPLLILSFIVWQDYLPLGDIQLFGHSLEKVLFFSGVLAITLRFVIGVAGFVLMMAGGLLGLGTLFGVLTSQITWGDGANGFIFGGILWAVGFFILRAVVQPKGE